MMMRVLTATLLACRPPRRPVGPYGLTAFEQVVPPAWLQLFTADYNLGIFSCHRRCLH